MQSISTVLVLLVAFLALLIGLKYLFAKQFMPYQATVAQLEWSGVPVRLQAVMLAMLRMVGAGLLAFGIALACLALPLSRGEQWSIWAIMALTVAHGGITLYVTSSLRRIEPTAKTPLAPAVAVLVLVASALAFASLA